MNSQKDISYPGNHLDHKREGVYPMFIRTSETVSYHSGSSQSIPPAFEIPQNINNSCTVAKMYDQVVDRLDKLGWSSTDKENPCPSKNRINSQRVRKVLFHSGLLDPATKDSWTLTEKGLIALAFRLLEDEAGEPQEVKPEGASATVGETAEDSAFHSQVMKNDAENLTALNYFLRINQRSEKAAGEWFVKLIHATMKRDFQSAVHLARDYFPKHLQLLSGDILFRIGVEFYRYADYEKARVCLEMAADKEGSWQYKALLILSRSLEALGNEEKAITILFDLLEQKPTKLFCLQAFERLRALQESQIEYFQQLTIAA